MGISVLLVEDQHIIRASIRALLENQIGVEVVGEASNGVDALELAVELNPQVVIMDVHLRGSSLTGIEATRKITTANKNIKVIALSTWDKIEFVKGMLAAGAVGYLLKTCEPEELMEAIHSVLNGVPFFSKEATQLIQQDYVDLVKKPSTARSHILSEREIDVLRQLALGKNAKEIADIFSISSKTVDAHRRNIQEKLKLYSIAELTKYAIREKIIREDE